jgi:hypothetical protein
VRSNVFEPHRYGNDSEIVWNHVANNANLTFRAPNGLLKYPYLVPAGVSAVSTTPSASPSFQKSRHHFT